jgi:hypothetical protein
MNINNFNNEDCHQLKRKKNQTQIQQKKIQELTSLDDIFDSQTSPDEFQDNETKTEFERYIEDEKKIDKDTNVLLYWKNNQIIYPTLSKIAQRVLCIPATNTCVERLFSDSGFTITNRRSRLQTSKVNQLLLIRRNLSTLRELFPPSIEQLRKRQNSSSTTTPVTKVKYSTENNNNDDVLHDKLDDNPLEHDDDKENESNDNWITI